MRDLQAEGLGRESLEALEFCAAARERDARGLVLGTLELSAEDGEGRLHLRGPHRGDRAERRGEGAALVEPALGLLEALGLEFRDVARAGDGVGERLAPHRERAREEEPAAGANREVGCLVAHREVERRARGGDALRAAGRGGIPHQPVERGNGRGHELAEAERERGRAAQAALDDAGAHERDLKAAAAFRRRERRRAVAHGLAGHLGERGDLGAGGLLVAARIARREEHGLEDGLRSGDGHGAERLVEPVLLEPRADELDGVLGLWRHLELFRAGHGDAGGGLLQPDGLDGVGAEVETDDGFCGGHGTRRCFLAL